MKAILLSTCLVLGSLSAACADETRVKDTCQNNLQYVLNQMGEKLELSHLKIVVADEKAKEIFRVGNSDAFVCTVGVSLNTGDIEVVYASYFKRNDYILQTAMSTPKTIVAIKKMVIQGEEEAKKYNEMKAKTPQE